jgi:RNA polymerase sigma factor (sigma-70 family)
MDMQDSPLDILPQNEWDAFIYSILKPFYALCQRDVLIDMDDLHQEAWVGLLSACETYDPTKSRFTTWAYFYIRGHVLRYIKKRTHNVLPMINEDVSDFCVSSEDGRELEGQDVLDTILRKASDHKDVRLLTEYFINGKSLRRIASEDGVSYANIAARINKLVSLLEIRLSHENA